MKQIKHKKDRVVYAASDILKKITHEEVEAFYNKSGGFHNHRR